MVKVYLGLGSNLGNKLENIKKAIKYIKKDLKITKISPVYKTEPVGCKNQDWFLNCAAEIWTKLTPPELFKFLQSVETKLKRKKTFKNGPRTIDIDVLFYGSNIIKTKKLIVPHPRMHIRLFVLEPLSKINPNFVHPKLGKTVAELKNNLKNKNGVELYNKKI